MSDARLYDDLIMDHIKNVRNYRAIDAAERRAAGTNPLCGDDVTVYLRLDGQRIADVAFQCTCCGISMASASIMTEIIGGRHVHEAKTLLRDFVSMLNNPNDSLSRTVGDERLAILKAINRFPARTRCAILPWATLEAALEKRQDVFMR